ncbi:hypothetical protein L3073_10545 [Ancylomarina sp. DW003]|nr:hypothetical protein [Ancylomarina sp. DW003]MDE5422645.1 hypothetical protein [Ancylomarina sp. DW003]
MKKILLITLILISCIQTHGQLIDVYETNYTSEKPQEISYGIVDINSNLKLQINRDSLIPAIGLSTNSNPILIDELKRYNLLIESQKKTLEKLNKDLSGLSDDKKIDLLGDFSDLESDLNTKILNDKGLETKFNAYMTEFLSDDFPKFERVRYNDYYLGYALEKLSNETSRKLKRIEQSISNEKIKIQLNAFLNTKEEKDRKIHVENFDEYNFGEFYEVERWVTSFSEEDVQAFNTTQKLANSLNEIVGKSAEDISNIIINELKSISCYDDLLAETVITFKEKDDIFTTHLDAATIFLSDIKNELTDIIEILNKVNNYNGKDENALELFNKIQNELITKSETFPSRINEIIKTFEDKVSTSLPEIESIIDLFDSCNQSLKEDIDKITTLRKLTTDLLIPFKKTASNGMEMGKEVFSYSIDDLPKAGYIDLKKTGKRSNGDNIVIRLTIKTQKDIDKKLTGEVIEKKILILQQIKLYSESNVSIILANPFNSTDKVKIDNKFQFAPSGSLLFKFGSRRYKTWNYLNPGLGFNISTPDFDLDGVPEVGIGGVVTVLQDVLSVGVSYNTKTDNPYWFFGVSLPFSTLGMPINTIKTNRNN